MVNFNLLPWRERDHQHQRWVLKKMLAGACMTALFVLFIFHLGIESYANHQLNQLLLLKNEFHQYQERHEQALSSSSRSYQSFFNYQKTTSEFFMGMGKEASQAVCFTEIARHHHTISFLGKARSIADLTDYLLSWKAANLFSEVKIKEIKQQENQFVQFNFQGIERKEE